MDPLSITIGYTFQIRTQNLWKFYFQKHFLYEFIYILLGTNLINFFL